MGTGTSVAGGGIQKLMKPINASRISVPIAVINSEAPQPIRLLKKKNMAAAPECALRR